MPPAPVKKRGDGDHGPSDLLPRRSRHTAISEPAAASSSSLDTNADEAALDYEGYVQLYQLNSISTGHFDSDKHLGE